MIEVGVDTLLFVFCFMSQWEWLFMFLRIKLEIYIHFVSPIPVLEFQINNLENMKNIMMNINKKQRYYLKYNSRPVVAQVYKRAIVNPTGCGFDSHSRQ